MLRTEKLSFVQKIKIWLHIIVLKFIKKISIYDSNEIIEKANSSGYEWKDVCLLGVKHIKNDMYNVLYCKPGEKVSSATVHMDDLTSGIAKLPIYNTAYSKPTIKLATENVDDTRLIRHIGTLYLSKNNSSNVESLSPEEHRRVINKIRENFNANEKDIYKF